MSLTRTADGPIAALREKEVELLNDIARMLADLGDTAEEDRRRLREVAQDLREMFFMVAVIGEFNAGKSSFVNALIGERLLPVGAIPTTEYIELIRHAEVANRTPIMREDGLREWSHPNTGAPGVAIVDTPGTGSVFQRHEVTAKQFLHRSDLVIFVISAKRAFANTERLYLELAKSYGKKVILVLNQVDLLKPDEQQEVRRFIEAQVKETLNIEPLLFMTSAREALEKPDNVLDAGGIGAVRAHLRGVYSETPPARQKLLAQLDTASRVIQRYQDELSRNADLVSLDITKVKDVQRELEAQSIGLERQMKEASSRIDHILAGVRERGMVFIDANMNIRRLGRGVDRTKLQTEFQDVVVGRSLREINESARDYIDAVVDQSRLYWRGVIDRLNRLQDLLEQELGGLDSGIYAEQRAGLQDAIRVAESELRSYSSGEVISQMEDLFSSNLNNFQGSALLTAGGLAVAVISSLLTPGPLIGVAAAPFALPAFIAGAAITAVFSVPMVRYYRRISRETKDAFSERVDLLIRNYHTALDELTTKERNRLTQYGNQILTPIFGRLEVLARRYQDQQAKLERYTREIEDLRGRIEALE